MANLDLFNEFWKRTEQEAEFRGYAKDVRQSRPFTLDAELTSLVSELAHRSNPKRLLHYLESARLPYPTMWLEGDAAGINRHNAEPKAGYHFGEPQRIGWLLRETPSEFGAGMVSVVRIASVPDQAGTQNLASIFPLMQLYRYEGKFSYENIARHMKSLSREITAEIETFNQSAALRACAWGTHPLGVHQAFRRMEHQAGALYDAEIEASHPLDGRNSFLLEPKFAMSIDTRPTHERAEVTRNMLHMGLKDQAGDLAFIVTALAILNVIPCRYVPYRPKGSIRAGGRLRPYMSSSIVSIEVPSTRRRIKEIDRNLRHAAQAASRARHEVRGHWRHVQKLPSGNQERWERAVDSTGRPCWRTWIAHHERGDAALGWVRQSYQVIGNRQTESVLQ